MINKKHSEKIGWSHHKTCTLPSGEQYKVGFSEFATGISVTALSPSAAEQILRKYEKRREELWIRFVVSKKINNNYKISPEVAEVLATYSGPRSPRDSSNTYNSAAAQSGLIVCACFSEECLRYFAGFQYALDIIADMTPKGASYLAKQKGHLSLNNCNSLEIDVAKELSNHDGGLSFPSLRTLRSERVAHALAISKGPLTLNGLKNCSNIDPLWKHEGELILSGLKTLKTDLSLLADNKCSDITFDGIETLPLDVLEAAGQGRAWVTLKNLRKITNIPRKKRKFINVLGTQKAIILYGMAEIELPLAKELTRIGKLPVRKLESSPEWRDLNLRGIRDMSSETYQELSKYGKESKYSCLALGMKEIDLRIAKYLSKFQVSSLYLFELEKISLKAASQLSKFRGRICISPDTFNSLPQNVLKCLAGGWNFGNLSQEPTVHNSGIYVCFSETYEITESLAHKINRCNFLHYLDAELIQNKNVAMILAKGSSNISDYNGDRLEAVRRYLYPLEHNYFEKLSDLESHGNQKCPEIRNQCIELLKTTYAKYLEVRGEHHPETLYLQSKLGLKLIEVKPTLKDGEKLVCDAISGISLNYGNNSDLVRNMRIALSDALFAAEDYKGASIHYREVLNLDRKRYSHNPVIIRNSAILLYEALYANRKFKDAEKVCKTYLHDKWESPHRNHKCMLDMVRIIPFNEYLIGVRDSGGVLNSLTILMSDIVPFIHQKSFEKDSPKTKTTDGYSTKWIKRGVFTELNLETLRFDLLEYSQKSQVGSILDRQNAMHFAEAIALRIYRPEFLIWR